MTEASIQSLETGIAAWRVAHCPAAESMILFSATVFGFHFFVFWVLRVDHCIHTRKNGKTYCEKLPFYAFLIFCFWKLRKFVAHYLPWFLGNNVNEACTRAGPSCSYKHDHWCSQYGNSYYSSYLGEYDITDDTTIDTQLDLMAASGLDGLWIDYQMATWDHVIDRIVDGLKARGMGFAIMVDSATFPDVMITTAAKVTNWTQEPHYYRHQGLPIVPIWNNDDTIFAPLPVNAIYISRIELVPPEWASDTYTWVSDTYLERPNVTKSRSIHDSFDA